MARAWSRASRWRSLPRPPLWFAPIPDVAKAVVGVVVYGAMLIVLRAIPDELIVEAKQLGIRFPR